MSFKPEVCTYSGIPDTWSGNALRFASLQEAEAYVLDLACRWTAVTKTRVIEVDESVTHTWDPKHGAQYIEAPKPEPEVRAGPWS